MQERSRGGFLNCRSSNEESRRNPAAVNPGHKALRVGSIAHEMRTNTLIWQPVLHGIIAGCGLAREPDLASKSGATFASAISFDT